MSIGASSLRRSSGACCGGYLSGNLVLANAVPEPATWALMLVGGGALGGDLPARPRTALAEAQAIQA